MNTVDQNRAFLDAVLARPEDDAPRLIYADYLEESGDPRGEFIRLQCELARLSELDPRYLDVSHRCDELLFDHRDAWAGELKQDVRKAEFARGFIDKITIRARAYIQQGEALHQSTPVHWLRFNYVKGVGAELAATDALSRLRFLDLSSLAIPDDDMVALIMSPRLADLEALNLAHWDAAYSESIGIALSQTPAAGQLRHLEVPGGAGFLKAMSSGSGFPSLEYLSLGTNYVECRLAAISKLKIPSLSRLQLRGTLTVADARVVASLPVHQLRDLDLQTTRIPAKGLKAMAERGAFNEVNRLSLAGCDLRSGGIDALFHGDQLRHCEALDLSHNSNLREGRNPDHFIESLVGHQALTKLRQLHLCGLNTNDIQRIAAARQFHGLEFLELEDCELGDDGLATLASSPIGQSLRNLKLNGCNVRTETTRGLRGLAFPNLLRVELRGGFAGVAGIGTETLGEFMSSPAFANVQAVNLDFLNLRSKALIAIAEHADLPELRQISYCHNHASRKSLDALMNSPGLPKLAKLLVNNTSGLSNRAKLVDDYQWRVEF